VILISVVVYENNRMVSPVVKVRMVNDCARDGLDRFSTHLLATMVSAEKRTRRR
jgi:hypothetical protein